MDLIAKAAEVLGEQPARLLHAEVDDQDGDEITLTIQTMGVDRIDIFDGSRPLGSIDVDEDGSTEVTLSDASFDALRLMGYDNNELVVSGIV